MRSVTRRKEAYEQRLKMSPRKAFIVLLVLCFGSRGETQDDGNVESFILSLSRFLRGSYEGIEEVQQAIFENFADLRERLRSMNESMAESLEGLQDRMTALEETSNAKLCKESTSTSNIISTNATTNGDPCEFPFNNISGIGCIYIMANHYDWTTGRDNCIQLGSDLFVAQDPGHFARLSTYIEKNTFEDFWLGVRGRRWLDGRLVADEEWGKYQPNKTTESCAGSGDYAQYRIWDWECKWKGHALCQKLPLKA